MGHAMVIVIPNKPGGITRVIVSHNPCNNLSVDTSWYFGRCSHEMKYSIYNYQDF